MIFVDDVKGWIFLLLLIEQIGVVTYESQNELTSNSLIRYVLPFITRM